MTTVLERRTLSRIKNPQRPQRLPQIRKMQATCMFSNFPRLRDHPYAREHLALSRMTVFVMESNHLYHSATGKVLDYLVPKRQKSDEQSPMRFLTMLRTLTDDMGLIGTSLMIVIGLIAINL